MARRIEIAPEIVAGTARVDRRTKDLVKRLRPGDVAVIDHKDLDRVAAEGLIEAGVGAVVNAAASISGRYPNVGPLLIAAAHIPLLDHVGSDVMDQVTDGAPVVIDGERLLVGDAEVATGRRQTLRSVEAAYEKAKKSLGDELELFALNTLEYLQRERHLAIEPVELPELVTDITGRHVLVVVRGFDYKDDLAHLRGYIKEMRPVLMGVDGGADALLEFGFKPDVIIGDMDSVSAAALRSGAELIVHAYPGGRAPGAERLDGEGLSYATLEASATSEDIAMLLAYEQGAELIVAVGTHTSMIEFLDKGRAGMASTFLTRLRVGPILVDAKGVNRLYQGRIRKRDFTLFLVAAMLCVLVVLFFLTPRVFLESLWLFVRDAWDSMRG
jgi:uncharacterized membrane-anchored protein